MSPLQSQQSQRSMTIRYHGEEESLTAAAAREQTAERVYMGSTLNMEPGKLVELLHPHPCTCSPYHPHHCHLLQHHLLEILSLLLILACPLFTSPAMHAPNPSSHLRETALLRASCLLWCDSTTLTPVFARRVMLGTRCLFHVRVRSKTNHLLCSSIRCHCFRAA